MDDLDELVTKAIEKFGPELTEMFVRYPAILRDVANGDIEYLAPEEARKAKGFRSGHDGKTRDARSGRFRPLHDDQVTVKADGIPWKHNTRGMLPAMRKALGLGGL